MKNNKGYTLVELLVAMAIFAIILAEVGAMMMNSSKLFLNGTYEIDLQTEAQQIVQQMEELLIDANVSVNVIPNAMGLSVNDIEIVNADSAYYIRYLQPDPSVSYGNIYLTAAGPYTATDELMGEYVESLSLNMAEFPTASKITLEVALRNDQYAYTTSKDIYLRNDIGLAGGRPAPSPTGNFQEELNVLRFKTYNLSSMYNDKYGEKEFIYQFQDGSDHNASYVITKSGTTYSVKASTALNNTHSDEIPSCLVDAIDPDTGSKVFTIKLSTDAVKIGAAGFGLFYEYVDTSAKITSPVHVAGISLEGADSITWNVIALDDGSPIELKSQNGSEYTQGGFNFRFHSNAYYVQVDSLKAEIREDWNSILFEGNRFMNSADYYNAIREGCMFQVITTFDYPTGSDVIVTSYMYPASANPGDAMPDDVADIFWNNCR